MLILLAVGVLAVFGAIAIFAARDGDLAAWLTRVAAARLPADRVEWGRAMVAELASVQGRRRRLRFAGGVLRVALFPPVRHRGRVAATAALGLLAATGATVAANFAAPELTVFVAVLGGLLSGYAILVATRPARRRLTVAHLSVAVVAVLGLGAAVASVTGVALAHPTAAADPTHLFSIGFAVIVAGYLAAALATGRGRAPWWALGGAAAIGVTGVAIAATTAVDPDGVTNLASPVMLAATFVAATGAAAASGSRSDGARAGLLTVLLGAPIQFAITVTAFLRVSDWTLTNPYDIAKYPRSGYPDVASYLLGDLLGGEIIAGLVLYPALLYAIAQLGAVVGGSLSRRSTATPRAAGG